MRQPDKDALEQFVDAYGLSDVLSALSDICGDKAEHLRSNWQDRASANVWARDARSIDKVASSVKAS